MPVFSFTDLEKQIRARQFSPVYFLFGEETYFIDRIARLLEETVLDPATSSFNFDLLYGPDISSAQLMALARAYPMMSPHRLIVVKEAHRMKKDEYDGVAAYLKLPTPSTIMVLVYKTKQKPDGRTGFGKLVMQQAAVLESKRLYERQVSKWIDDEVRRRGFQIKPEATQILVDSLGTNLQLIDNELDKITLHLKANNLTLVQKELVYELVNIDKDYNVFELINHVGGRNVVQCHRIIHQMMLNTKEHSPLLILSQLFSFFSKLALLKQQRHESTAAIAQALNIQPFIAERYVVAVRNFTYGRIQENLGFILEADLALKGITQTRMPESHILKTLIYRLLQ
jgi:DNA polymerase-3 subunit delta